MSSNTCTQRLSDPLNSENNAAPSPSAQNIWSNIDKDIFQQVLRHINMHARVGTVGLVCKRWLSMCLEHPPQEINMAVDIQGAWCKAGFLAWVTRSMGLVQDLHIELEGQPMQRAMLAQALSAFAISSPCLTELAIECPDSIDESILEDRAWGWQKRQGWDWDNWATCLPMFKRLKRLNIYWVKFMPDYAAIRLAEEEEVEGPASVLVPENFFDGLNLQDLTLWIKDDFENVNQGIHMPALGNALLGLSSITRLDLGIQLLSPTRAGMEYEGGNAVISSIVILTTLRELLFHVNDQFMLPPEASNLRALTLLSLEGCKGGHHHLANLPNLCDLSVGFCRSSDNPGDMGPLVSGASRNLTRLAILAGDSRPRDPQFKVALPTLLPVAALRKMRGLVDFKLQIKGCTDFSLPAENGLLSALPQLTSLDLSGSNLWVIPSCTALTNLKKLDVSKNMALRLTPEFLGELSLLSHLRCLNLTKGRSSETAVWSVNSFKIMLAIREKLPDISVQLE